eukprot:481068_1
MGCCKSCCKSNVEMQTISTQTSNNVSINIDNNTQQSSLLNNNQSKDNQSKGYSSTCNTSPLLLTIASNIQNHHYSKNKEENATVNSPISHDQNNQAHNQRVDFKINTENLPDKHTENMIQNEDKNKHVRKQTGLKNRWCEYFFDMSQKKQTRIYFEKQSRQMSMLHALNMLFQKEKYSEKDLDKICKELNPNSTAWSNPHKTILLGNYDANVLEKALQEASVDFQWFDSRFAQSKLNVENMPGCATDESRDKELVNGYVRQLYVDDFVIESSILTKIYLWYR